MFNRDFYPTPPELIQQMLSGVSVAGLTILEPSAGKGDIVDYLKQSGAKDVLTCETNPDLQHIIKAKSRLIAPDFLTVRPDQISHIDLIIMNPPFSRDVDHITHAFEIAPAGCIIIALCNGETLKNRYSSHRQALRTIIDTHGSHYFVKDAFISAERRTDVEVAVVTITKPGSNEQQEYSGFFIEEDEEEQANGLISYNVVRDIVNRYVETIKLFDQQIDLAVRIKDLAGAFLKTEIGFQCTSEQQPLTRNNFKKDLQKSGWQHIFKKMNMEKYMTKTLREELNKFVEIQSTVPFTMRNIYRMIEIVAGTNHGRMEKAIIEVFDSITKHYDENRYSVPGWKTNNHYLVGKKFIIPYLVNGSYSGGMGLVYSSYSSWSERIDDLQKALCYITGTNFDDIGSLWTFFNNPNEKKRYEFGTWYQWGHFEFKGFKKQSAHFKFKDEKVWETFNREVARIKGYPLPEHI